MNKLKPAVSSILTAISALLFQASTAFAQIENPVTGKLGSKESLEEARSGELFVSYFVLVWNAAITIGAIVVIVMFIMGAVQWITSGDDASKVQAAQRRLTNAIIGIIILVASFTIIAFISRLFFGDEFSILSPILPFANTGD